MDRLNIFIAFLLAGWLSLFFTGCAPTQKFVKEAPADRLSGPGSDEYAPETMRLLESACNDPSPPKRMAAHLKLARLYASDRNPDRNYQKALEHLEIYTSLDPGFIRDPEAGNWLAALREIDRLTQTLKTRDGEIQALTDGLEKSSREIAAEKETGRKLREANKKLEERTRDLEVSNSNLTKTLELLKTLDRDVEAKRKNFSVQH
jgi:hypothetical protein